jgi:hypothetical protein
MGQLRVIIRELGWVVGFFAVGMVLLGVALLLGMLLLTGGLPLLFAIDDLGRDARDQRLAAALDEVDGIEVLSLERRGADLGAEDLFATVRAVDGEADALLLSGLSAAVEAVGPVGVQLVAGDRTIGISPRTTETLERLALADELLAVDGVVQATVLWERSDDDPVRAEGQEGLRAVVQTDRPDADLLALAVTAGTALDALGDRGTAEAVAPPGEPLAELHERVAPDVQEGLRRVVIDFALHPGAWDADEPDPASIAEHVGETTRATVAAIRSDPGVVGYDWRIAAGGSNSSPPPGRVAVLDDDAADALCAATPAVCGAIVVLGTPG